MAKINTLNYQTVAAWNGSQDLFVVEQPDGTKVATPAMVKQFIEAGDFAATGNIEDGDGNQLADIATKLGDPASASGVTGDDAFAKISALNSNLVGNVDFTLTFSSAITDINVHGQKCFYNPATKRVDIYFDIYSSSGLIPGRNGEIATVPSAYRVSGGIPSTALCLTTDNKLEAEGIYCNNGYIALNNFISGKANYRFVSARFSYYLN